ncbi:MAG: peptidoglycan DD-metalloendopeptidase family protein [Hyphomonadaceae bacterium]|nr:peptidoglycan DD-metalloendopeptidase family protein [Hyphomonadaceae bacterium]
MAHGAKRAGAAVALAAVLLAFSDSAPAQTAQRATTARQAERARVEATREAQRVRAQARRTEREIAALDRKLEAAAQLQAETETATLASEQRVAELEDRMAAATRARANDQAAIEAMLIACVFEERAQRTVGRARARRAAFAQAMAGDLATASKARTELIAATRAQQEVELQAQEALVETQAALDAERTGIEAQRDQRRRSQETLIAAAAEAERRAAQHAAEARSLAELARRVQGQRRTAAAAPAAPLGRLQAPVAGRVVTHYGQTNEAGRPAAGVTWRTAGGAQVASPVRGTVGYAGPFRSYGHILILNLDNGYAVVLAGMADARKRTGERVEQGEIVGLMPRTADPAPAPELYVEIRRNGRPIDPSGQFAARSAAAADGRAG